MPAGAGAAAAGAGAAFAAGAAGAAADDDVDVDVASSVALDGATQDTSASTSTSTSSNNSISSNTNILICTDAASRGLDLPYVRRIIQHEFATNVVQHLHRVGRASRAGAPGIAVAIYDASNTDLLAAITKNTLEVIDSQGPTGAGAEAGAGGASKVEHGRVPKEEEEAKEGQEKKEEGEEEGEEEEDVSAPAAPAAAPADSIERAFSRRRGLKGKIKKSIRRAREHLLQQEVK